MTLTEQMARDEAEAARLGFPTVLDYLAFEMKWAISELNFIANQPDRWTEAAKREAPAPRKDSKE